MTCSRSLTPLRAALTLALVLSAPLAWADAPSVLTLARPSQPEWFGLYLMERKAGWTRSELVVEERAGARVLVARVESSISAQVGGRSVQRTQLDEKVYEARPGGRLLAFSSRRSGDGGDRNVEGRCDASGCRATLTSAAGREERRLPPFSETVEQADPARLAAVARGEVKGEQLELETLRVRRMTDRFTGEGELAAGGAQERVRFVEELEEGDRAATRAAIAADGRVLELRLGDAVVVRAEPEATARRLDRVELFSLTRVPLPRPLGREVPGAVRFVLRGVPAGFQTRDDRQSWAPADGGAAALTVRARTPLAADPARDAPRVHGAPPAALRDLLESTPEVDADEPSVAAAARQAVGGTHGVYAASVKILHFVYGRLEKAFGVSRDRASEVLAFGKGDCTEHALLFTALARAAGIPARQVQGLVYARYDDGVPALYWHAWVEVKSGDEWIAMDPTFDQPVADATHIALGRGARPGEGMQADTVAVLGSLKVAAAERLPPG